MKKAATNEKREREDRDELGGRLEDFLTRKEDQDEATGLMGRNVEKRGSCATKKL